MRILISHHAGFCFGVKRAVRLSLGALKNNSKKIFSLGPLIHNPSVIEELKSKGLEVIKKLDAAENGSCIVLPSHGADLSGQKNGRDLDFVDTTCPFVYKAQVLVKKSTPEYEIVILGDKNHPEVKSLVGISGGKARVVEGAEEARKYRAKTKRLILLSQTTQSLENFADIVQEFIKKGVAELKIYNTICKDAAARQKEAERMAEKVDVMFVIGGKTSANTKRLANVAEKHTKVHHIENEGEIKDKWLRGAEKIGIITGASTPGSFIKRVKDRIRFIIEREDGK